MISRRSLIFGMAGIAAVAAGAGADRLIAIRQMERAAAVEHTKTTAQLIELTARFDQRQNQALQQSASNALRDKVTAVQQVEAQLPSGSDPAISHAFAGQLRFFPWLNDIRRSTGFLEYYGTNNVIMRGTAEIVDRKGTLVFAAHEFPADNPTKFVVTFFPRTGESHAMDVEIEYIDRKKDLAFGTIKDGARLMRRYGLKPVQWAPSGTGNPHNVIFIIGFAEGEPRLHLATGWHDKFQWVRTADNRGVELFRDCLRITKGPTFEGMSGGSIFQNGKFKGILNFSVYPGLNTISYSTPAEVLRQAYLQLPSPRGNVRLFPGTADNWPDVPAQCANRANVMTLAIR